MMQFVIAAPRSGSGKTTVTCALLAALKKRGMGPCAFKSARKAALTTIRQATTYR